MADGVAAGPMGYRRAEFLRAGLGAPAGIALAALAAQAIPGGPALLPFIVTPMGATAVLPFAAPASPLAQPWSLLVGNVASTLVGVTAGRLIPDITAAAAVAASRRVGVQTEDIREAMARLDRGLDILPGDVIALVREAEAHALDRRLGQLRVGTMARDVQTVQPGESLYRARMLMNQHHVKALPVVDAGRRVVGILTADDLFNLDVVDLHPVSKVMTSPVTTVGVDTPVARLVSLMTDLGLRHLPVVDDDLRLVGIVTRTELIAVLNQALIET